MSKPLIDTKAILFEGVLTEIIWGQRNPQYRSVDFSVYNPTTTQIDQEGTLKEQISLYLCWCGGMAASDKTNNTGNSNDILIRRNQIVHALLTRMTREQLNYPALIVLANDYQTALPKTTRLVCV